MRSISVLLDVSLSPVEFALFVTFYDDNPADQDQTGEDKGNHYEKPEESAAFVVLFQLHAQIPKLVSTA